jgi:hypothetical protein
MKLPQFLIALTVVNVAALLLTVVQLRSAVEADPAPMLRGRGLQIVDDKGQVRASITILPASTQSNGDKVPETVLLRLITEKGRPSVKISTSEEASNVSLAGPSNTKNTWTLLESKGTASRLQLKDEAGAETVISPTKPLR